MNDKIKALVLSINDYKENDLLLQVISDNKSFLSLIVKGAKKVSGKQHFNNLCVYEFIIDYKDTKTIYSVHGSKLVDSYYEDTNLKLLSFKNIIIELCLKARELYEPQLYQNTVFTLSKINELNMFLLGSLYISYLLKINGLMPNVDKCVVCGKKQVVSISNNLGGFLCAKHIGGHRVFGLEQLKKFRLINKADFINYPSIQNIKFESQDFQIMMDFLIDNCDLNLKSYQFYKQLFN